MGLLQLWEYVIALVKESARKMTRHVLVVEKVVVQVAAVVEAGPVEVAVAAEDQEAEEGLPHYDCKGSKASSIADSSGHYLCHTVHVIVVGVRALFLQAGRDNPKPIDGKNAVVGRHCSFWNFYLDGEIYNRRYVAHSSRK